MPKENKIKRNRKVPHWYEHTFTDYTKDSIINYINFSFMLWKVPWSLIGMSNCLINSTFTGIRVRIL